MRALRVQGKKNKKGKMFFALCARLCPMLARSLLARHPHHPSEDKMFISFD